MWPSHILSHLTKASFAKYGYTSQERRIRPLILRIGLCFSLSMGVLLMGAGWKMAFSFFSPEEVRKTQQALGDVFVKTSRFSPVRPLRHLFVPQNSKVLPQKKYTILQLNAVGEEVGKFEFTELPPSMCDLSTPPSD